MNKTKQITQAAMMLAIVGAVMLLNMRMGGIFSVFITLVIPVTIIVYSARYTVKDGAVLAFAMGILGFVLGAAVSDLTSVIFYPVGALTGIAYSFGVPRNYPKQRLLFLAMAVFVIGEVLASFVLFPLLGFPIDRELEMLREVFTGTGNVFGDGTNPYAVVAEVFGNRLDVLILIVYILSTVLTGVMEGLIIHILAVFLLKRFKIRDLGSIALIDHEPNPLIAYAAFILQFVFFVTLKIEDTALYSILISFSLIGSIILIYYGYIFVMLYGRIVLKKNVTVFLIFGMFFLLPVVLPLLLICGFLYGSGPLRRYILSKRNPV